MNRRSFLKVALATIATPIIARAALVPEVLIPGIERVTRDLTPRDLDRDVRFANAIFTPGNFPAACDIISSTIALHLPPGVNYEVRAVPLAKEVMRRYVKYGRSGYACVWVTEASMQRSDFLGPVRALDTVSRGNDEFLRLARGRTAGEMFRAPGADDCFTLEKLEKLRDHMEFERLRRGGEEALIAGFRSPLVNEDDPLDDSPIILLGGR